jgi:hypothetical protein
MSTYVPPTGETNTQRINQSLQQIGPALDTATANITTNTTNIATNATNITALQTKTTGYEAAWTAWAPTVTPGSGTFTTVSASGAYLVIGKLVHFTVTITITNAGTAAGTMSIPLPTGTAKREAVVFVSGTVTTGNVGYGRILTGATAITAILKYDNLTYIGTGNVVTLTGFYEQT